jgi:hypothetical protein
MRTIRYILLGFFVLSLVGTSVFFAARETFLSWGSDAVKDSLRELVKSARGGTYVQDCSQRIGENASISPDDITVQLRFVSSNEYVMEAICPQFAFDPIVFAQGSLPEYVTRVPGSSGMVYGGERSGVVLEVFGDIEETASVFFERDMSWISKRKAVVLAADAIQIVDDSPSMELGSGPVTSCSGYGYACCSVAAEKGTGNRILGLNDCPDSCYSSCIMRPMVLAFNSSPFFEDATTRVVRVRSNTAIEFSVVSNSLADAGVSAIFDFGDGEMLVTSDLTTPVAHRYSCATSGCQYTATVQLVDAQGIESAETSITQMVVLVE